MNFVAEARKISILQTNLSACAYETRPCVSCVPVAGNLGTLPGLPGILGGVMRAGGPAKIALINTETWSWPRNSRYHSDNITCMIVAGKDGGCHYLSFLLYAL